MSETDPPKCRQHDRETVNLTHTVSVYQLLSERLLGMKKTLGFTDNLASRVYTQFDTVQDDSCHPSLIHEEALGGVFNLEYSLNGRLLAAACEAKKILLFDAGTHRHIKTVENAHSKCVNCIKFLDGNTFASGSDDALIKLWDIRNLSSSKKTLHGHASWVKNIEWSEQEHVMVSSAFDGAIYAWNLNSPTENSVLYDRVFQMTGLVRMKLTPDGTKMLISTTSGFLIIIHNVNLMTLFSDFASFQPSLYRMVQESGQYFPSTNKYNYLFSPTRTRNRIEFIDDFPNDAEVISSLQIHPHGWSALSRNMSRDGNEEWTTVHDIQERCVKDYEEAFEFVPDGESTSAESVEEDVNLNQRITDIWTGSVPLIDYQPGSYFDWGPGQDEVTMTNSGVIRMSPPSQAYFNANPNEKNKLIKNLSRMTHYIQEENVGGGFIKVLSFSLDGRIIGSPFDRGIRLLGFSDNCQELSSCVPETPTQLKTIVQMKNCHKDVVLSCKFSPVHYQLATGCLGGQIKLYQPVF